jgi:hypothetical protein
VERIEIDFKLKEIGLPLFHGSFQKPPLLFSDEVRKGLSSICNPYSISNQDFEGNTLNICCTISQKRPNLLRLPTIAQFLFRLNFFLTDKLLIIQTHLRT